MIDTVMGAGPQLLEGPGTNSAAVGAYPVETFQTPLLDLTKTYANIELVPARPGYYPVGYVGAGFPQWVIESASGTQTSPPTVQVGSDAAHQNTLALSAATPTNAKVNVATPPTIVDGPTLAATTIQRIPNAPVFFDLTVPAAGTGGYSCMARLVIYICWIAVG
jgi:hypothetical protein